MGLPADLVNGSPGGFLRYAATSAWRFGESACALLQEARVAAPINDYFAPLGLHPLATRAITIPTHRSYPKSP
jgi:hypothetical protein